MIDEEQARRHLAGAKARAAGARFETWLDRSFKELARRGEGLIEKTPEPMRPVKSLAGGKFVAVYDHRAQPDYKGTLRGGRTVIFEAKYCGGDRIEKSRVKDHQAAYMRKMAALGAECYVLAGFEDGAVFRIPWADFDSMAERFGHRHIKREELDATAWRIWTDRMGTLLLLDGEDPAE